MHNSPGCPINKFFQDTSDITDSILCFLSWRSWGFQVYYYRREAGGSLGNHEWIVHDIKIKPVTRFCPIRTLSWRGTFCIILTTYYNWVTFLLLKSQRILWIAGHIIEISPSLLFMAQSKTLSSDKNSTGSVKTYKQMRMILLWIIVT